MTDHNDNRKDARRQLLKTLVAGGGVMASGKLLPDEWSRPVVESVLLPAHAQTTGDDSDDEVDYDGVFAFVNVDPVYTPHEEEGILDMFAGPAHADVECVNSVSAIVFSVSDTTAQVCVLQGILGSDENTTSVDTASGKISDVKVGSLNLYSMSFNSKGSRINGQSDCGPFSAKRTDLPYKCSDSPSNTTTSIQISEPINVASTDDTSSPVT